MLTQDKCNNKSDEELVQLTLKSQDFFYCLVKNYEAKLTRYIRRISSYSQEDIEDLLQEIFIKVYKNLNAFDDSLKFSSWIYRIAHNETISHFRKQKSRPQTVTSDNEDDIFNNIASDFNLEKETDTKISREKISQVLAKLDIKYREVLVLKFFEDKSYQEMSDILKKPTSTIGTLINRAKKNFFEKLKELNLKI